MNLKTGCPSWLVGRTESHKKAANRKHGALLVNLNIYTLILLFPIMRYFSKDTVNIYGINDNLVSKLLTLLTTQHS